MGVSKKKIQPPAPVAGPSKLKPHPAPESKMTTDLDSKNKPAVADKPKEKPKPTGKLEFFSKPKAAVKVVKKEVKEAVTVKKEEQEIDPKKKLFFSKEPPKAPSKAPSNAPSPAPSVAIVKDDKEPPVNILCLEMVSTLIRR
jgi:DNA polymerase delta subunit 3